MSGPVDRRPPISVQRPPVAVPPALRTGPVAAPTAPPSVAADVIDVLTRVRDVHGATPALEAVADVALRQAHEISQGSLTLAHDADLDLWHLREPGYLRVLVEATPPPVRNARVLLPVLLSWVVLGVAEVSHLVRYAGTPADQRPPFFSTWMNGPEYLSPVLLSVVIVASVGWLMVRYRAIGQVQDAARRLARSVSTLECELLPPLTRLREESLAGTSDGSQQQSAEALLEASRQLRESAEQLGGSVAAAADLRTVLDRLLDELPDLGREALRLESVKEALSTAGDQVEAQSKPLVDMVLAATRGAVSLDRAMVLAGAAVERAANLERKMAEQAGVLDASSHPFVRASSETGSAAKLMNETAQRLQSTAADLQVALERARWFSLVADGIRHPEPFSHDGGGPGASA